VQDIPANSLGEEKHLVAFASVTLQCNKFILQKQNLNQESHTCYASNCLFTLYFNCIL